MICAFIPRFPLAPPVFLHSPREGVRFSLFDDAIRAGPRMPQPMPRPEEVPVSMRPARLLGVLAAVICGVSILAARPFAAAPAELWRDVEVIRTAHGVPHIRAANLRAGGYALAWAM